MTTVKKVTAVLLAFLMLFGSVTLMASAASETFTSSATNPKGTLSLKTEILREENGEWIATERVKPGENVKMRVYIGTDYTTAGGKVLFFYDKDFFTDNFAEDTQYYVTNDVNDGVTTPKMTAVLFSKMSASNTNISGYNRPATLTDEYLANHVPLFLEFQYTRNNDSVTTMDGSVWFYDVDLQVRDDVALDAEGRALPDITNVQTIDNDSGFTNVSVGIVDVIYYDDGAPVYGVRTRNNSTRLGAVDVTATNTPVTVATTVTFDANEGTFASNNEATVTSTDFVGAALDLDAVEVPERAGATFKGWTKDPATGVILDAADLAAYPYEDLTLYAVWADKVTLTFVYNNGTADEVNPEATSGADFSNPTTLNPSKEGYWFIGWSTDESGATVTGLPEKNPGVSTTYYAIYEARTYPVYYYVLDPDTLTFNRVSVGRVAYGDPIPTGLDAALVPEGYTLSDAYKDFTLSDAAKFDGTETMPAESVNVYYKLTANEYTAHFISEGVELAAVTARYGETIVVPDAAKAPTKAGYAFDGWDPDFAEDTTMDSADMYFYATFIGNEHTVTYKVEDETYDYFTVRTGARMEVAADPDSYTEVGAAKEGYEFIGWIDADDDAATVIAPAALANESMPDADKTYIAAFEVKQYTVIIDPDDLVDGDETTITAAYGTEITAPTDPTKEGYTFTGWDKAIPATVPVVDETNGDEIGTDAAGEKTYALVITGQWQINSYTVTYTVDGAQYQQDTFEYDADITLPAYDVPAKEGYTAAGWTGADQTLTKMPAEDLELIAVYNINSYTLTFDANAGAFADDATTVAYDGSDAEHAKVEFGAEIAPKAPAAPERHGYIFAGWAESADGEAVALTTMPASDKTYYAVWENGPAAYTVNYYMMKGDGTYDAPQAYAKTGTVGETVTPDIVVPEGYHIDTALSTENLQAVVLDDDSAVINVYYARNEYTVTFQPENGEENTVLTHFYGTALSDKPDAPTKEGYTFAGWDPAVELIVVADATYTAQWEINAYDVIYNSESGEFHRDSYNYDADVTLYDGVPTDKIGYTFSGWEPATLPEKMPANDITLTAQYTINSYTATFDPDEGAFAAGVVNTKEVEYNAEITAIADRPMKEGYQFLGWAADPAATTPDATLGTMNTIEGKTFYAVYEAVEVPYAIEYYEQNVAQDGYVLRQTDATGMALTDSTLTITPDAPRAGFVRNAETSELTKSIAADGSTVFAIYDDRITYTLTVNENKPDGTSEAASQNLVYGAAISVTDPADYEGYHFTGWTIMVGEDAADEIPETMPNKNVGLTGNWETLSYNVKFVDDDGSVLLNADVLYGDPVPQPAENPSKVGYEFTGWDPANIPETMPVADDGLTFTATYAARTDMPYELKIYVMDTAGNYPDEPTKVLSYNDGVTAQVKNLTAEAQAEVPAEGFTLVAEAPSALEGRIVAVADVADQFAFKAYIAREDRTVTLKVEGQEDATTTYKYGAAVAAPETPSKGDGYTFSGWVDEENNPVSFPIEALTEDVIATATFVANPYPANFNANGGIFYDNSTVQTAMVDYTAAITAPAVAPTYTGYVFQGWAATDSATEALADLGTMDTTEGKIFYAVWTPDTYVVTYYVENTDGDFVKVDERDVAYLDTISGDLPATYTVPEGYALGETIYKDVTLTTTFTDGETMPHEDVNLYYTLEIQSYTVTFQDYDNTVIKTGSVAYGAEIVKPADPTREGYTFAGWTPAVPATMPAQAQTFTATYTVNQYNLKFVVDGTAVVDKNLDFGASVTAEKPAEPTKTGYTFAGWDPAEIPATMPANALTFNATWTKNSYDAVFSAGDGAFDDGDTAKTVSTPYGEAINRPADPTREGYTFGGWTPDVPAAMPAEAQSFSAIWNVNSYKATFIVDGVTVQNDDVAYGAAINAPTDPTKTGYTFAGWTSAIPAAMPAEDQIFVATWDVQSYELTFKSDDAALDGYPATLEYGAAITAPTPTKQGYVLSGWALEADPATAVTVASTMPANDLTYVAIWTEGPANYTVNYYTMDTTGAYGAAEPYQYQGTTGETVTAAANPLDGFKVSDTSVTSGTVAADNSLVLNVYYERLSYNVKFQAAGGLWTGVGTEIANDYYYGATVEVPAEPTRTGYHFAGWTPDVQTTVTADATYTAQWEKNDYTVTYIADGSTYAEQTYKFQDTITAPSAPEKYGFDFMYWYETNEAVNYNFATPVEANVTLTAHFEPKQLPVAFYRDVDAQADADVYAEATVDFGDAITAPDGYPAKAGYTGIGWATTSGATTPEDLGAMDTENGKIFYAVYEAANRQYTVEHYFMNAAGAYEEGPDDIETLTAPTASEVTATPKTEANFTVDEAASTLTGTVPATGALTLSVYYAREKYALTIDPDNGTAPITSEEYFDAPITVPTEDPTKEGYTFQNWVDGDGNEYDTDELPATMPGAPLELTAVWEANEYTLTFKPANGDADITAQVKTDADVVAPAEPTREGYTFAGWFTEDQKRPDEYPTMPANDLTFTAAWNPLVGSTYYLNLYEMDTEGNYPAAPTSSFEFSDGIVDQEIAPDITVPAGFTLDEDDTDADGVKSVVSGTIPTDGSALALNVYFKRNQWTFRALVPDDPTQDTVESYYYQKLIPEVEAPEIEGYTFEGWHTGADSGDSVAIPTQMPNEDFTAYAWFTKNSYNVIFDANGGAFETAGDKLTVSTPFEALIAAPTERAEYAGFTFVGWTTEKDNLATQVTFGSATMPAEDVTYYAYWSKDNYSLKIWDYVPSEHGPALDDTMTAIKETELPLGAEIEFPADPAIDNYEFLGWSTVKNDPSAIVSGAQTMPAEDMEYFAVYKRIKVMLIPASDEVTTVIDRDGLTVDDYTTERDWFVYGLVIRLKENTLGNYVAVQGDGRYEIDYVTNSNEDYEPYTGTGTIINVYDNVTDELVESFTIIIYGDLNGDAFVNTDDYNMLNAEVRGMTDWSEEYDFDNNPNTHYRSYSKRAADLARSGSLDSVDLAALRNGYLYVEIDQVNGIVK